MTEHDSEISTIRMSKKAKKILEEFGTFSDTHETIIMRLVDHCKSCKKCRKVNK